MQKRSTLFITLVVLLILADVPGWMTWRAIQRDRIQQDRIAALQGKEAEQAFYPSPPSYGHGGGSSVDAHQNGAQVNPEKSDQTPLCAAIESGSLKEVQKLIAQGADIKAGST